MFFCQLNLLLLQTGFLFLMFNLVYVKFRYLLQIVLYLLFFKS